MQMAKCEYNGERYNFSETIKSDCVETCTCQGNGKVLCEPHRCPKMNHTTSEKCLTLNDPNDSCCKIEVCDVTLDDYEAAPMSSHTSSAHQPINQTNINNTTTNQNKMMENKILKNNEPTCQYKNETYNVGQIFHDKCDSLCVCEREGIHCDEINCPTNEYDSINSQCLKWEPEPATFRAIAPKCCPERMRCIDNGTCDYKGHTFDNWAYLPTNLTGCNQQCTCENGKIDCRNITCPPVPAIPPQNLPCPMKYARLMPTPDDECCKHWSCLPGDTISGIYNNNNIQIYIFFFLTISNFHIHTL